jgi:hypothetical protein
MTTLHELKEDIDAEIKRQMPDLLYYPNSVSDKLDEVVEAQVPIHQGEMVELLESDHSLAHVEEGTGSSNPSVWDIIQVAVREQLRPYAEEEFERQKKEYEELVDELENMDYGSSFKREGGARKWYIYRNVFEDEQHPDGEEIIKEGFDSEYEAWMWLEEHQEEVEKK